MQPLRAFYFESRPSAEPRKPLLLLFPSLSELKKIFYYNVNDDGSHDNLRTFSWLRVMYLFGSIWKTFKLQCSFFLSAISQKPNRGIGKIKSFGCMNCIFVDHVLCVKSACRRCLLLIYGRIIRLGHLINFLGAIISW